MPTPPQQAGKLFKSYISNDKLKLWTAHHPKFFAVESRLEQLTMFEVLEFGEKLYFNSRIILPFPLQDSKIDSKIVPYSRTGKMRIRRYAFDSLVTRN